LKNFNKDTRDRIEKLYKRIICEKFPKYGTLWNLFVGDGTTRRSRLLRPYGMRIPSSSKHRAKEIRRLYLTFTQIHYTLFCNLAGAHYQLNELKKSLSIANINIKYFKHWEAFECLYSHLGIVRNSMYGLWGVFFELSQTIGKDKFNDVGIVKNKLAAHLTKNMYKRIKTFDDKIITIRENITHFSRISHLYLNDKYYIPLRMKRRKYIIWDKQLQGKGYQETWAKACQDIENIETLLNSLHSILIHNFNNWLMCSNISIKNTRR